VDVDDNRGIFVVEVDDEADEDVLAVLLDVEPPQGFSLCNTERFPNDTAGASRLITAVTRIGWHIPTKRINQQLSTIFQHLYNRCFFKVYT